MTLQIIDTKNGTIEFSLTGIGIPILFVHGGHGNCNETLFHKGFDLNNFSLIIPSRPGYGETPLSTNYSPKDTSDLFIAILDKLKIVNVVLIGISAGGLTAIELAANYPNRIKKMILISAVTKKWMTEKDRNYRKGRKLFSPQMEKYTWALFRFFYYLFPKLMAKTMFKELSTHQPINIANDEVVELQRMINKQRSHNGFINDLDQDIEQNVISEILCPTLILHSSNDNAVNIDHAKYAVRKIKNSIIKIYDNKWGHLLWLGKDSEKPINDTLNFITDDKKASL